jgi:hypothetical protein
MNTDGLIRTLAADTKVQRSPARLAAAALPPALVVALATLWWTLGFRDDLVPSLAVPEAALRFLLTGAAGLLGLRMALTLARPEGRGLVRLWPLAGVALLAAAALLWAWLATPPAGRQMAVVGKTMVTCLVAIPLLSILPVAAVLAALRRGATTAPALAGFAAGVGGSGLSAMIYALHCTEDSPLFYVTWYGLAMAGVTLVATLVGQRLLRW